MLLLLGGSGMRFGSNLPKQFHLVANEPLFKATCRSLCALPFRYIVLVVNENYIAEKIFTNALQELTLEFPSSQFIATTGGNTRHLSFLNGLKELKKITGTSSHIAVHDANRPFISESFIENIRIAFNELGETAQAAVPVIPVTDSILQKYENEEVQYPDRSSLFAVQTPQLLFLPAFENRLQTLNEDNYTDEGSMALALGLKVFTFEGDPGNVKITYPSDLKPS